MTDITTSVDGKNYENERFLYKRRRKDYAVQLALKHPEMNLDEIRAIHAERYPNYTQSAFRQALREHGLYRSSPRKRRTLEEMEDDPMRRPRAKKVKPSAPIRASVHSYSGRSRLSAGYVEL